MRIGDELVAIGAVTLAQRDQAVRRWQSSGLPASRRPLGYFIRAALGAGRNIEGEIKDIEERREAARKNPVLHDALNDIASGSALLFVGAGFSAPPDRSAARGLTGDAIRDELVMYLRENEPSQQRKWDMLKTRSLPIVAQHFEHVHGKSALIDRLRRICAECLPVKPFRHHATLAELAPFPIVVTTNWDRLIEAAFEHRGGGGTSALRVVRENGDAAYMSGAGTTLIKLHGDFDHDSMQFVSPPTVTELDFRHLGETKPLIFNLVRSLFASYSIVAVGFNPRDHNFEAMLDFVYSSAPSAAKAIYIVDTNAEMDIRGAWPGVHTIHATASEFMGHLEDFFEASCGKDGVAYRLSEKNVGARPVWAPRQCELARELIQRFSGLRHVEVVSVPSSTRTPVEEAKHRVGLRAASVLRENVIEGSKVALSCGSTLKALVDQSSASWANFRDVALYSTTVPALDDCNAVAPMTLISALARSLETLGVRGRSYHLPVSLVPYLADPRFCEFLHENQCQQIPELSEAIEGYLIEASKAETFVLGVGSLRERSAGFVGLAKGCLRACRSLKIADLPAHRVRALNAPGGLDRTLADYLTELNDGLGYVGDVMYRPFKACHAAGTDPNSVFMSPDRVLECLDQKRGGVSPLFSEFLARLLCHVQSVNIQAVVEATRDVNRSVILVASGAGKAEAVGSLCNAGVGNILVVDESLAVGLRDWHG